MRSVKRVIAATALGLPIMFGAPAMAFAGGHENSDDQSQVQDQDASTEQSNSNVSPIYQFHVGSKGEQNAVNAVDQDNNASTEENAGASQSDED
ncbi:hypothetical protein [Saccharopolyspora oryzae]|uniref:Secreted protein n=1 Tax=Saccharopolyspora oryzae TaxID=2997343 RepID=A0ABT4UVX8_9PSEU|nr:hypothetical protein [Saccharopolyspora oryzae]MDA3625867.1 hypothetical protein [Saccharopolyspora oryzae]